LEVKAMATQKSRFEKGDKVKFYRTHDKATQLIGTVVDVPEGDDDFLYVESIVDGKKVEVSTTEHVHAADVEAA
jgi:hypothetical protein